MTSFRDVTIGDLFDLENGKAKYVKAYLESNGGQHPVYSASVAKPFGFIDSFDYEGPHLTWVMNGYGGRVLEVNGKFSANRDRGVLVPKVGVPAPDLTYIRHALEPTLRELAVGRRVDGHLNEYTKVYPKTAATAVVSLPVTDKNELDYALMSEIGDRLRRVENAKTAVEAVATDLRRAQLIFNCPEPFKEVSLGDADLFTLAIGSRLLLKDNLDDGIPAYSANVMRPFGHVESTNLEGFEKSSLIWGIDGNFDWNLIPAGEQFEITDHCGRVQIQTDDLDPRYVLFALRATKDQYGFDRVFRASLTNMRANVTLKVPTDGTGQYSLGRQLELAEEYGNAIGAQAASESAIDYVTQASLGIDF